MANCSNFTLKLSGRPFKLKQARDGFIKTSHEFGLIETYHEEFTNTSPTWELHGKGKRGVDIWAIANFLEPYELSGIITDSEPGADFFCKVVVENGIITNRIIEDYISDVHYEHCPDNSFWYKQLSYVIEDPEAYFEIIEFMLKHNILSNKDLKNAHR